jgi:hypothetical protein
VVPRKKKWRLQLLLLPLSNYTRTHTDTHTIGKLFQFLKITFAIVSGTFNGTIVIVGKVIQSRRWYANANAKRAKGSSHSAMDNEHGKKQGNTLHGCSNSG